MHFMLIKFYTEKDTILLPFEGHI